MGLKALATLIAIIRPLWQLVLIPYLLEFLAFLVSIFNFPMQDLDTFYFQALYAATLYEEAMKVTVTVEGPQHQTSMLKLQAAIRYKQDRFPKLLKNNHYCKILHFL